jgi:hypothetical protein
VDECCSAVLHPVACRPQLLQVQQQRLVGRALLAIVRVRLVLPATHELAKQPQVRGLLLLRMCDANTRSNKHIHTRGGGGGHVGRRLARTLRPQA